MSRPIGELEVRAMYVLQLPDNLRKEFVEIAATKSPSAAFDLATQLATLHGVNSLAAPSSQQARSTQPPSPSRNCLICRSRSTKCRCRR